MTEISLDVGKQAKAKEYARIRRRMLLIDLALGGAYSLAWLLFGWSGLLKSRLLSVTNNDWLLVAGSGAFFGAAYFVLSLPSGYYQGFILQHRYELSNQTLSGWISDQVKSLGLGVVLGGLMLEIIYAVLRAAPETWWLWVAAILLFFNVILANLAPVLIFPIFYKFVPLGAERADLVERLTKLAERAGARVRGIYKFDMSRRTKAANAALTGLGNSRRILLGDTLLEQFTDDEIETVLAHELAHHVHKDIPAGILVESLITLVGLYLASIGLHWGAGYFGFENAADVAALPLFALVLGAYGLATMPFSNAFSRWRERQADRYALEVTGKGDAYASALTRLANQNLAEADPEAWVEFWLYSHPALGKRIARANQASRAE